MTIQIIQANTTHAAAIASIGKKAFRTAFEKLFNSKEELLEYLEYSYEPVKLVRSIKKENNVFFIALADQQAVGFIKVKRHSLNDHIESVSQMELQKIYLLPEYQGQGIGQQLINAVFKLAEQLAPEFIWLDTHISNEKAIHVYERNGFEKTGRHHFTIGTQTFEYHVMALNVSEKIRTTIAL